MKIQILYFSGCPGVEETVGAVERVVSEGGHPADVQAVEVTSADHPGFSGSPTVLIDGEDPFPSRQGEALSCRLYATPEGPRNSPTGAMLRAAIGGAARSQTEAS